VARHLWWLTHEALLGLLGLAALARASFGQAADGDRGALGQYVFLVMALAALCAVAGPQTIP
jgi:hypothetical protein